MKLYVLKYEQAQSVSHLIQPGVLEEPDADKYWYFAATEEGEGFIGAAVINPSIDQPKLLSIRVISGHRRQGYATELLQFGIDFLRRAGASALRLSYAMPADEWVALDGWLTLNGFTQAEDEQYSYETTVEELAAQKLLKATGQSSYASAVSISKLSERAFRAFRGEVVREGYVLPELFEACDPEHSFVWLEENHIRTAYLLSPLEDGVIHNIWGWLSPKAADVRALQALFVCAAQKVTADYPSDTIVHIPCLNQSSDHLVKYLLPEARKSLVLRTYEYLIGSEEYQSTEEIPELTMAEEEADANGGTSAFGERQADARMDLITNENLCCGSCIHCLPDSAMSCVKYKRKPGAVFYGGDCPMYEER